MSLLSLVVAFVSFLNAQVARDEAADAERLAEALSPAETSRTPPADLDPSAAPPAGSPPPAGAPPLSIIPEASFTVRYAGEVLNPQATTFNEAYLELDEPRVVLSYTEADIALEGGSGSNPPYFALAQSDVTAAEAASPEATPEDCLERLRTSPLPPDAEVPAQRGTVLCVLTSLGRASEQGISQKVVVLHVSALGDDGRVTIEANAWDQPR